MNSGVRRTCIKFQLNPLLVTQASVSPGEGCVHCGWQVAWAQKYKRTFMVVPGVGWRVRTNGQEITFGGNGNVSHVHCDNGHTICNLLEISELSTQNR